MFLSQNWRRTMCWGIFQYVSLSFYNFFCFSLMCKKVSGVRGYQYSVIDFLKYRFIVLPYITLHYRHFKCHLHQKWAVVHQQFTCYTAHQPSTQASYTASRVRPKRKISRAAAQIVATLTISFPRWHHRSLTSYWGQQRMSLTSYPVPHKYPATPERTRVIAGTLNMG